MKEIAEIFRQKGYKTSIIAAGTDKNVPYEQLLITMSSGVKNKPSNQLELVLIPGDGKQLSLQFLMPVAQGVNEARFAELSRFILFLNEHIPVVGFHFNESVALIYFKFLLPLSDEGPPYSLLISIAQAIDAIVNTFVDVILNIANDKVSLESAKETVQTRLKRMEAAKALHHLYSEDQKITG